MLNEQLQTTGKSVVLRLLLIGVVILSFFFVYEYLGLGEEKAMWQAMGRMDTLRNVISQYNELSEEEFEAWLQKQADKDPAPSRLAEQIRDEHAQRNFKQGQWDALIRIQGKIKAYSDMKVSPVAALRMINDYSQQELVGGQLEELFNREDQQSRLTVKVKLQEQIEDAAEVEREKKEFQPIEIETPKPPPTLDEILEDELMTSDGKPI